MSLATILRRARQDPDSLTFGEFEQLLKGYGWTVLQAGNPMTIWQSSNGAVISVQDRDGAAVGHQVTQFLIAQDASY